MENHLHPVPESGNPPSDTGSKRRRSSRPRTTKALPTDRLKFSVQVAALKAFAIESGYGKEAVGSEQIAPRMGVSAATAGLNNAFFMETGLIKRERKGHYKPSEAVVKFARNHGFDPKGAARLLGEPLKGSWPFREVQRQLQMGPTTKDAMVSVLGVAVGGSSEHKPQLDAVLEWLEFAGLITIKNGNVELTDAAATTPGPKTETDTKDTTSYEEIGKKPPADPAVSEPTTDLGGEKPPRGEALLSFSFDFALTVEDLKELSPEQIQALYEAVGKLMAIKAGMNAQK